MQCFLFFNKCILGHGCSPLCRFEYVCAFVCVVFISTYCSIMCNLYIFKISFHFVYVFTFGCTKSSLLRVGFSSCNVRTSHCSDLSLQSMGSVHSDSGVVGHHLIAPQRLGSSRGPCNDRWILNHWTTEVPVIYIFILFLT